MSFLMENYALILAMMSTGIIAGVLAGLLGVGGGIVIVPVLFFLYQVQGVTSESAMLVATATSLTTIIPTSISSIYAHNLNGNVDFSLLKQWGGFIFLGSIVGGFAVTRVEGEWLTILFGVIVTLSAINMLFGKRDALFQSLPGKSGQGLIASGIGFFSAMVGIGGGTLTVPTLTSCNYPAHRAVGTAAVFGLFIALPGATVMLVLGQSPQDAPVATLGLVNLVSVFCIVPMTVLFAPVGAGLASRLNAVKLKKAFAFVLIFTGIRMLYQVLV